MLYKPVAEFHLGFNWSAACPWHPAPEPQTSHMSECPGPGPVCLGRLLAPQGSSKLEIAVPCGLLTLALEATAAPALQGCSATGRHWDEACPAMEHSVRQLQWEKTNVALQLSCWDKLS